MVSVRAVRDVSIQIHTNAIFLHFFVILVQKLKYILIKSDLQQLEKERVKRTELTAPERIMGRPVC